MSSVNLVLKQTLNITCMKSDTFRLEMQWLDGNGDAIDLTGYTFKSQVRDINKNTVILEFTDSDFSKDSIGNLTMFKSSSSMGVDSGNYHYDIQATEISSSEVYTWLGGLFIVQDDITE
jgi:hypothetical protein